LFYKEENHTVAEIAEMLGVSRMTIFQYVKEEKLNEKLGEFSNH